jgi:comEA protein
MIDWGLTKQEKYLILFLILTFVAGLGIRYYKMYFIEYPDPRLVDYARLDSLRQEFVKQSQLGPPKPVIVKKSESIRAKPLRVNINSAGLEELMQLPRVGPVMAEKILKHRAENGPFKDIADLQKVKGIGKKTFSELKVHITVK